MFSGFYRCKGKCAGMKNLLCFMLFVLLIVGCSKPREKVIVLQPFGDFPKAEGHIVLEKIKKTNPNVILRKNLPFPTEAWYQPRNRYRADILLKHLRKMAGNDTVMVGLSQKDISTEKGKIKDWGVMGLGYQPGKACVVSTFRLSDKNRSAQFYKVVLHELGHTQGLPHCPGKSCFMRDAEGGNPLDDEIAFCASCKNYLALCNWKLKS